MIFQARKHVVCGGCSRAKKKEGKCNMVCGCPSSLIAYFNCPPTQQMTMSSYSLFVFYFLMFVHLPSMFYVFALSICEDMDIVSVVVSTSKGKVIVCN